MVQAPRFDCDLTHLSSIMEQLILPATFFP